MSTVYLRPELAEQMASQLLNPGVLDEGLRSGLFLFGMRRTGKTTIRPMPPPIMPAGWEGRSRWKKSSPCST
ncbi:hypothetical protein [Zobellella denitrificans]|uniref:hypothetical protein n=1 Tax=Zobellella denitrificans TaxID=347534 RepID=UPI0015955DE2|nr:hypothetical protein [Zobellella denitrificans]